MTRVLSLILATGFVILAVALFPGLYFLHLIQDPERVARELDPWMIYAIGLPAVAIELEKDSNIEAIQGTLLHTTRGDIIRLLQRHFTMEDVRRKALEVHHGIVNDARCYPGDSLIFFVSVTEEKEVILPVMHDFFERKIERRDGCSVGSVLDIAWMGLKDVFGDDKTDIEALHELPRCDPPGAVKNQVMDAVDARVAEFRSSSRDSIRVSPNMSLKAHRRVKAALLAGEYYLALVPVLLVLLLGIAVLNRRDASVVWLRLGAPLLISGLSVLAVALPFSWTVQDLNVAGLVYRVDSPPLTDSTGQWLNLVFYVAKGAAQAANRQIAFVAAFTILAGLLLIRQHQRKQVDPSPDVPPP